MIHYTYIRTCTCDTHTPGDLNMYSWSMAMKRRNTVTSCTIVVTMKPAMLTSEAVGGLVAPRGMNTSSRADLRRGEEGGGREEEGREGGREGGRGGEGEGRREGGGREGEGREGGRGGGK